MDSSQTQLRKSLRYALGLALVGLALLAVACQSTIDQKKYAHALPPGEWGLVRITNPSRKPSFEKVGLQFYDPDFQQALDRSLSWFKKPSTMKLFPSGPITHAHAWASVYALKRLTNAGLPHDELLRSVREQFDIWSSKGYDGSGQVLFTGYYAPVFKASFTRSGAYQHPIYARPDDLVTKPGTGEVVGRNLGNKIVPYPTRAQIERRNLLAGRELVYLPSKLDAYLIEVNGSAKLRMADGSTIYVGYAGSNGRAYVSLAKQLLADGKIDRSQLSITGLRQYFHKHPDQLEPYLRRNPRMIFFKQYQGENWPAGSLGVRVTPMRSLATDKDIFPRGCPVYVQTHVPQTQLRRRATGHAQRPFNQLMLDQDTGGAIRAAGRADVFTGIGDSAAPIAHHLLATGRLYYLLLKPAYLDNWKTRLPNAD